MVKETWLWVRGLLWRVSTYLRHEWARNEHMHKAKRKKCICLVILVLLGISLKCKQILLQHACTIFKVSNMFWCRLTSYSENRKLTYSNKYTYVVEVVVSDFPKLHFEHILEFFLGQSLISSILFLCIASLYF